MTTVVGVRFREVGKIYYFDPGELQLNSGDNVIVDTVRGTEFGTVMIGNSQVEDEEIVQPLKVVRRMATDDDVERMRSNREKEKNAFNVCKEKIKERGLDMKLISAEYTFDNAKILFYFTADGRVDFRELVKDLAAVFKIRIELRQVGVRDETKLMGGLGGCGRPLCCASYLSDFVPVSIRMAKEQNLSLNPQKISGVCGRLMCCLKNEADTYEDLNTRLPKDGGKVVTPDGREGVAETVNVLRERVRVLFTDEQGNREMEEFAASDLKFTPRRKCKVSDKSEEAENRKKLSSIGDMDETVSELIEEVESEEETELKALEMAEIEDILEPEKIEITGESEKREESRHNQRRHHRRHGSNHERKDMNGDDQQGVESPKREDDIAGSVEHKNRDKQDDSGNNKGDEKGETSHRHRHHHHRRRPGNDGNNGEQQNTSHDGNVNTEQRPDNLNKQSQGNNENSENRKNGAHRRFRKRRPENNSES